MATFILSHILLQYPIALNAQAHKWYNGFEQNNL